MFHLPKFSDASIPNVKARSQSADLFSFPAFGFGSSAVSAVPATSPRTRALSADCRDNAGGCVKLDASGSETGNVIMIAAGATT